MCELKITVREVLNGYQHDTNFLTSQEASDLNKEIQYVKLNVCDTHLNRRHAQLITVNNSNYILFREHELFITDAIEFPEMHRDGPDERCEYCGAWAEYGSDGMLLNPDRWDVYYGYR